MSEFVLKRYTNGIVKISGGPLNGVEVLDWQKAKGRNLIYLNEVNKLREKKILGLLRVRTASIKDEGTRRRAIVSNSGSGDELQEYLKAWSAGSSQNHNQPTTVWLGVRPRKDYGSRLERRFPPWLRGVKIAEAEDPTGCFAVIGYGRKKNFDHLLDGGDLYYHLLVRDCGLTPDPATVTDDDEEGDLKDEQ